MTTLFRLVIALAFTVGFGSAFASQTQAKASAPAPSSQMGKIQSNAAAIDSWDWWPR